MKGTSNALSPKASMWIIMFTMQPVVYANRKYMSSIIFITTNPVLDLLGEHDDDDDDGCHGRQVEENTVSNAVLILDRPGAVHTK